MKTLLLWLGFRGRETEFTQVCLSTLKKENSIKEVIFFSTNIDPA